MKTVSFHHPKGRIRVKAYFFGLDIAERIVHQRVLTLWKGDSRLYQTEFGFILLQKKCTSEFVERCLATPLFEEKGSLSNVLLDNDDSVKNQTSLESVCLAIEGQLHEFELTNNNQFDPSKWLDLNNYSSITTCTLGEVKKLEIAVEKQEVSVRNTLGDESLKETSGLQQALEKLNKINRQQYVTEGGSGIGVVSLFTQLKRLFVSDHQIGTGEERYQPNLPNPINIGLFRKIKNVFSQFLMASALAKAIGKSNAKHVQKMMDQFNDGNIEEALRNAIPLASLRDALEVQQRSLSLKGIKLPESIQPYAQAGSGSMINLDDNLLYQMEQMYERAFKKYDQEGNFKKAAFILAELLRDIDRAVEYLEKHEQYQLAAELAEGQKLEPARIVRQWFIAKNLPRALEVAVISGSYQQAITMMEEKFPEEANELRWYCAKLHYKAGNLKAAVDIAWPIDEKRSELIEWMKLSAKMGGEVGMEHLLRLALYDHENYQSYIVDIHQRFESDQFREGLQIIDEIIKVGKQDNNQRIASMAARYYLSSIAEGLLKFDRKRWNQLCMISGDLTLRADVRGINFQEIESRQKQLQGGSTQFNFEPSFGRQAEDCVLLANDQQLVAFGEAGVELWNARGEVKARFSTPCHSIVVSDEKNSCLLITSRSGYQIVHQFDLSTKKINYWLELELHSWSDTFDGHTWIVSHDDKVFVLNTLADDQETLWSINQLKGIITNIVRTEESFSLCIVSDLQMPQFFQIWVYSLPNLYLQERTPHQVEKLGDFRPEAVNEKGDIIGLFGAEKIEFGLYNKNLPINWIETTSGNEIQRIVYIRDYICIVSFDDKDSVIEVYPVVNRRIHPCSLLINMQKTKEINLRLFGSILNICSDEGRIVMIDLDEKQLVSDFVLK